MYNPNGEVDADRGGSTTRAGRQVLVSIRPDHGEWFNEHALGSSCRAEAMKIGTLGEAVQRQRQREGGASGHTTMEATEAAEAGHQGT